MGSGPWGPRSGLLAVINFLLPLASPSWSWDWGEGSGAPKVQNVRRRGSCLALGLSVPHPNHRRSSCGHCGPSRARLYQCHRISEAGERHKWERGLQGSAHWLSAGGSASISGLPRAGCSLGDETLSGCLPDPLGLASLVAHLWSFCLLYVVRRKCLKIFLLFSENLFFFFYSTIEKN